MKNKLFTFLGIMFMLPANANGQEAPWRFSRVESPQIHSDRSVTFNLFAPAASEIVLNGGWMGWGENVTLVKNDTGLWSVTVGPLAPEMEKHDMEFVYLEFVLKGILSKDLAEAYSILSDYRHKGDNDDLYEFDSEVINELFDPINALIDRIETLLEE